MPEYMPHLARVGDPATLISTEFAAFIQKEINNLASRMEQQQTQFMAELSREREDRVKDVTDLYTLREKDVAEVHALKRALPSLHSSEYLSVSPRSADAGAITIGGMLEFICPNQCTPSECQGVGTDPANCNDDNSDIQGHVASSTEPCLISSSQETPGPEHCKVTVTAADDIKKLDCVASETNEAASSMAQPPEVVGTEQSRLTRVAAGNVTKKDGPENEGDNVFCSNSTPSPEIVCIEQGKLATARADNMTEPEGAVTISDDMVCSVARPPEVVSTQQGRLTTVTADNMKQKLMKLQERNIQGCPVDAAEIETDKVAGSSWITWLP